MESLFTERHNKEGIVRKFGKVVSYCVYTTLLYSKWITNKTYARGPVAPLNVTWQPGWEGGLEEWRHVYVTAESLHCSPAATRTLLTVYTPVQNKKLEVFIKLN